MAKIALTSIDPTLAAADQIMQDEAAASPYRTRTVAMSQIGDDCSRRSWYAFRWVLREVFDAVSLKRFDDGHAGEAKIIERLKKIPGITLIDKDPETDKQFTFIDCDGHAKGKSDGKITGIFQAPKKLHVFEAKVSAKLPEFRKIKLKHGEKNTLREWNSDYFGQAQLYMHYEGTDRHYTVVGSPGVRDWDSCRTDYDHVHALKLKAKMDRVVKSNEPLQKVSQSPDWFQCKICPFIEICHSNAMPDRGCRTCLHSSPISGGRWHCDRFGKDLTLDEQAVGCPAHKFLPPLVPGEVIGVTDISVTYRMPDNSEWTDSEGEIL